MADDSSKEKNQGQEDEVFSLDDLDEMLEEEGVEGDSASVTMAPDPTLASTSEEEGKEEGKKTPLWERFPIILIVKHKFDDLLEKPKAFINKYLGKPFGLIGSISEKIKIKAKILLITEVPERFKYLKSLSLDFWAWLKSIWKAVLGFSKIQKVLLLAFILLMASFVWLGKQTVMGKIWWPQIFRPNITKLEMVADRVVKFEPAKDLIFLANSFSQPHYTFLLDGIVVNLKRSYNSTRLPMVRMEVFLKLNSAETAIEVKDRKLEIKDYVSRLIEELSYDELLSQYGKKQLKMNIRNKVNEVLNDGRVTDVYFKEMVYKR